MIASQRAIRVPCVMARWLLSLCLTDAMTTLLGYVKGEHHHD